MTVSVFWRILKEKDVKPIKIPPKFPFKNKGGFKVNDGIGKVSLK
jgi:hypothetical protein